MILNYLLMFAIFYGVMTADGKPPEGMIVFILVSAIVIRAINVTCQRIIDHMQLETDRITEAVYYKETGIRKDLVGIKSWEVKHTKNT